MSSPVIPTPTKPKLSSIEAARGIAAMMVVFYHAARHIKAGHGVMPWGGIAQFGHAGVDFFFVLSGFIIFFVHQKDLGQPSRLGSYFQRRFTRIYPLFWVSLAVGVGLTLLSSTTKFKGFGSLLADATLLPFGGEVGVAWTLQHEILFYLIFALAMISRRIGLTVFSAWLGVILLTWATGFPWESSPLMARLTSTFNLEFFFGMMAAYFVKKYQVNHRYFLLALGVASFAGFAIAEDVGWFNGYQPLAQVAYGLSSMLVVIGIASANLKGLLQAPRLFVQIGNASYSVYLLHLPCIGIIYKLLEVSGLLARMPLGLVYLVLSAGAIGICVCISRLIEYPLMDFVRGLIAKNFPSGKRLARQA